ncbi:MAG TPA: hypothetical protein VJ966_03465 [Actinomycetes bacterium]|nr:hypothetical protein [Actinomycetes bacterium]
MPNLFDNDAEDQTDPFAGVTTIFQFESGTRCPACGKYHADQWWCDPEIPNPWATTTDNEE